MAQHVSAATVLSLRNAHTFSNMGAKGLIGNIHVISTSIVHALKASLSMFPTYSF